MTKFFVAGHALIDRESKYLLTRRSKINTYMPLKWDIPGGIVEPGETIEEAIYREVSQDRSDNSGRTRHLCVRKPRPIAFSSDLSDSLPLQIQRW